MIPPILSYMPSSVELLGPTTPPIYKPKPTTPLVFQTRLMPL